MAKLTVRKVDGTLGVQLPAHVVKALRVKAGDQLFLHETRDGFHLTAFDPDFEEAMRFAENFMARYRNALHALAD